MLIGDTLRDHAINMGEKPAIVCEGEVITFAELFQQMNKLKTKMNILLGNGKGKKVGFLLPNDPRFLQLFFASVTSGFVAMPFDPKWSSRELYEIMKDVAPDILIAAEEFASKLEGISDVHIVYWNSLFLEPINKVRTVCLQIIETSKMNTASVEDIFYIGFTSGTTGKPKGYMRTHLSWLKSFESGEEIFEITGADTICAPGPLYHSLHLYGAAHALHLGATIYILKEFKATSLLNLLQTTPISVIYLVPTMAAALLQQFETNRSVFNQLEKIISSGAKWQPDSKKGVETFFPRAKLYEFYGASELSFVSVLTNDDHLYASQSVGKAFPGIEIQIRSHEGFPVGPGEIGKVFIKSDQVFKGYVNDEKATKETLHGDWATVGDIGYVDDEGYLFLVGREKNMIISGGLNIYPEEVEMFIEKHDSVREAVVIGVDDWYWGEMVVAAVRCYEGKTFDANELKAFCRNELSTYKCPRTFIEVSNFIYTSSGKIARKETKAFIGRKLLEGKESVTYE